MKVLREDWLGKPVVDGNESFPLISAHQVHGDEVITYTGQSPDDVWNTEADALITREKGVALGVFTADCLPILLFDPRAEAIGIVHAGWRGTAKFVSLKTAVRMQEVYFCRPENMIALMGPCIGPCCYEVDAAVREKFAQAEIPWELVASARGKGRWSLDLCAANGFLLGKAGVSMKKMHRVARCTRCSPDEFYSHRAGQKGRQLNFIALRRGELPKNQKIP